MSDDNTNYPDTGPITETRNVNTGEYRIRKLEISTAVDREQIKALKESVKELKDSVDALTAVMQQSKGGWKVLAAQGGLIAFLAGLIVAILEYLKS